MSWPTPQDYNEAIQSPSYCFGDPELKQGRVETNALGLPRSMTGAFASVYKIICPTSVWAVRCFLTNRADLKERYLKISDFVLFDDLECTMDFYYLDKGIKVKGTWYPALKMKWVDGTNLDQFLNKNFKDSQAVRKLIDQFYFMAMELERAGIAHGDLQHGNIMVTDAGMRLVDYDALYVPALAGKASLEIGHPNYQHPERNAYHYDTTVDHFSMWLIHLSLLAVAIDPSLFEDLGGGDECILLRRSDLANPYTSQRFRCLLEHSSSELRAAATLVLRMLYASPDLIPPLNASSTDLNLLPQIEYKHREGGAKQKAELLPARRDEASSGSSPHQHLHDPPAKLGPDSNNQDAIADLVLPSSTNRYEALADSQLNYQAKKKKNHHWKRINEKISRHSKTATKWFLLGLSPATWHAYIAREGDSLFKQGDYEEAIKAYAQAYSVYEAAPEKHSSAVMEDLLRLGRAFALTNNMSLANNYFLMASRLGGRLNDEAFFSRAEFLLAACKGLSNNYDEAIEKLRAMPRLRAHLGTIVRTEVPNRLICHASVFKLLAEIGDSFVKDNYKPAGLDFYHASLDIFDSIRAAATVETMYEGAQIKTEIGLLQCEQGQCSHAKENFVEALQLIEPLPDSQPQIIYISFLLSLVQVHLSSPKDAANKLYSRMSKADVSTVEAAWRRVYLTRPDNDIVEMLEQTGVLLSSQGQNELARVFISISWRLALADANFSPARQAAWLERFDEASIMQCLKSSFLTDESKFKSYPSALIEELARKSNSKAALAYAGLLTELSLQSSTGSAKNKSNKNVYLQHLDNLARSMVTNSTVANIVETVSYSCRQKYFLLIDLIVMEFAHANRLDTLTSIACRLADSSGTEISREDNPQLTAFDYLLASIVETNSKRAIEKTIAGLIRNEAGKALISSALRLAKTRHDVVAAIVVEFTRQNDDWSLDQIVGNLAESHNLDALEHASAELALRWKTNALVSIAMKLARKDQLDSFDRVVAAIVKSERSRVVSLVKSLADADLSEAFLRTINLIPVANQNRYLTKIIFELAEHGPMKALPVVIDKVLEGGDSHCASEMVQCLARFGHATELSEVAGRLIASGQQELVQKELLLLSNKRNDEMAAILAYEILACERGTTGNQLRIVNKLLKNNNLTTIAWLIFLIAKNGKNDWLEDVSSAVANHRRLGETESPFRNQSGRAYLEHAINLARQMKDADNLTAELWSQTLQPEQSEAPAL